MPYKKTICAINEQVSIDPFVIRIFEMLFEIANENGLKGVKLSDLEFEFLQGAFDPPVIVNCMVHQKMDHLPDVGIPIQDIVKEGN